MTLRGRFIDRRSMIEAVTVGSALEALAGTTAAAVAIVGLTGSHALPMLGVGAAAAGVGILAGGMSGERAYTTVVEREGRRAETKIEVGGGLLTDILGGAAGIVLAVPMLLGLSLRLGALGVLVMGVTLVFGSGVTSHINVLRSKAAGKSARGSRLAEESIDMAGAAQLLLGLGAATCGVLALHGVAPLILALVGVLALGLASLLTGSALEAILAPMLRRA